MNASEKGYTEALKLLLDRGADVNAKNIVSIAYIYTIAVYDK
jgi:ankyrin repeat protein